MAHFILTSRYNSSYRQTSVTKNLFDGVGIERRDARRSRFEIFSRRHALHCNVYDIANIDSIVKIAGLRDDYGIRRVFQAVRFDQINVSPLARVAWSHDVCGLQYNCQGNRFASCPAVTLPYNTVLYGVYDALPPSGRAQGTALFDAETERPITGPLFTASGIFDVPFENIYRATNRFNSVVDFCRLDLNKGLFDGVRDLAATAQRKNCFDICVYVHWHDIVPIRYDIPHPPSYARFIGLYDIIAKHGNCSAARRQPLSGPVGRLLREISSPAQKFPSGGLAPILKRGPLKMFFCRTAIMRSLFARHRSSGRTRRSMLFGRFRFARGRNFRRCP